MGGPGKHTVKTLSGRVKEHKEAWTNIVYLWDFKKKCKINIYAHIQYQEAQGISKAVSTV